MAELAPLAAAVTVSSPCTGCSMSIVSPTMASDPFINYDRLPIFRFVAVPHTGCEGGGTWQRLIPIMTVYQPLPQPEPKRRWWQRLRKDREC